MNYEAIKTFLERAEVFSYYMGNYVSPIKWVSFYRGMEEQYNLFLKGATKAKPGQSAHNYALALDYAFQTYGYNVPKEWWSFGDYIARSVGLETGIAYDDAGHIQLPGWKLWTT